MDFNHREIEAKWQKYWYENETFKTDVYDFSKPKYYVLDMFPYPSGHGLHVGHPEGYTASDIVSRKKRMEGYNVLHPMGYDSFGLPAEQYAITTGNNPEDFTLKNIETFIQKSGQYVGIEKLTSYALHELVKAIYVDAPDKSSGKRQQHIHIKYDGLGFIPLDELMKEETA